ncbi:MotA/TolQ/ExbB proton channel family protein [Hahella sp. SMD15-11]|uniref:MotA/TolQ/ExbB proton channel family protein n=1 Tax=Thermohahella caldifontis TaxID=3142973 RepID=A0AB39UZR1_9GAMM
MFELLKAGGLIMIPILLCSVLAVAIIIERFWTLRIQKIAPPGLVKDLIASLRKKDLNAAKLREIKQSSPLGQILAAGLVNARFGREIMKESIEEEASHVIHELERFLTALGTIAAVSPLLGLLGTVVGMIDVFTEIQVAGTGNTAALAGGISKALITTASGLTVAIPALVFHRYFQRRVDEVVVEMEQQALRVVEVVHGEREPANGERKS